MPRTTHHPDKTRERTARGRCAECAGPMPHRHGSRTRGRVCPGCAAAPPSPPMQPGRNAR